MALALSLVSLDPATLGAGELAKNFLAHRDLIVTMTFGVVILSILGQALSMKPLLKLLGMLGEDRKTGYEELQARIKAAHHAMEELDHLCRSKSISDLVHERLRSEYEARVRRGESLIAAMQSEDDELHHDEELSTRRALLAVERDTIGEAFSMGMISEDVMRKLVNEIDKRKQSFDGSGHGDEEDGPGEG